MTLPPIFSSKSSNIPTLTDIIVNCHSEARYDAQGIRCFTLTEKIPFANLAWDDKSLNFSTAQSPKGYSNDGDCDICEQMPLEWKHWQGQTINGKFALGEYLGGSENSAVFLTSLSHPQKAAIKLLAIDANKIDANEIEAKELDAKKLDAQNVDRQLSLWASAKELSHPHIVRLLESGQYSLEEKPLLYVVMEYAEENLSAILPTRALTLTETREMLDPVLEVLAYIHGQGFVHGHIKPSNIMAVDDNLKISSDGITKVGQSGQHSAKGSSYLPPEAASGGLSTAADIWSLGITLVEVLSQQAPIIRSDEEAEGVVSALPQPFREIAAQCLRVDPQQRCTIAEIQNQLHSPVSVSIPAVSTPAAQNTRRGPIILAATVLLATVLGGLFLFKHRSAQSEPPEETMQTQVASPPGSNAEKKAVTDSVVSGSAVGPVAPGKVIHRVLPDVSNNALRTIQGTIKVKVRVQVDAGGNVENARLESSGPSRYFANKAVEAAKQWKFEPLLPNGKNVPGQWDLEFRFGSTSRQVRERPVLH